MHACDGFACRGLLDFLDDPAADDDRVGNGTDAPGTLGIADAEADADRHADRGADLRNAARDLVDGGSVDSQWGLDRLDAGAAARRAEPGSALELGIASALDIVSAVSPRLTRTSMRHPSFASTLKLAPRASRSTAPENSTWAISAPGCRWAKSSTT